MKVQTKDLIGAQLDWAVAKCEYDYLAMKAIEFPAYVGTLPIPTPSTNWAQGGPIIEREKIGIGHSWEGLDWLASAHDVDSPVLHDPTPLVAAMRAYVTSKLGAEVEVPDDLT